MRVWAAELELHRPYVLAVLNPKFFFGLAGANIRGAHEESPEGSTRRAKNLFSHYHMKLLHYLVNRLV